jgi:hypothetical protein
LIACKTEIPKPDVEDGNVMMTVKHAPADNIISQNRRQTSKQGRTLNRVRGYSQTSQRDMARRRSFHSDP